MLRIVRCCVSLVLLGGCAGALPEWRSRVEDFGESATCPQGGQRMLGGSDTNGDGILSDDEVESTSEFCDAAAASETPAPRLQEAMEIAKPQASCASKSEFNVQPCTHGTCVEGPEGFECACESGFAGDTCDLDIDECVDVDCGGGACIDGVDSYTCECDAGFEGYHCELPVATPMVDGCEEADLDSSGDVSPEELAAYVQRFHAGEVEAFQALEAAECLVATGPCEDADLDGSGAISQVEQTAYEARYYAGEVEALDLLQVANCRLADSADETACELADVDDDFIVSTDELSDATDRFYAGQITSFDILEVAHCFYNGMPEFCEHVDLDGSGEIEMHEIDDYAEQFYSGEVDAFVLLRVVDCAS